MKQESGAEAMWKEGRQGLSVHRLWEQRKWTSAHEVAYPSLPWLSHDKWHPFLLPFPQHSLASEVGPARRWPPAARRGLSRGRPQAPSQTATVAAAAAAAVAVTGSAHLRCPAQGPTELSEAAGAVIAAEGSEGAVVPVPALAPAFAPAALAANEAAELELRLRAAGRWWTPWPMGEGG